MKPRFQLAMLAFAFAAASSVGAQARNGQPAVAAAEASAPSEHAEMENGGKLAAQGWLALLDRQDWGTAWDASSAVFRQTVPLGSWMDAIPKVRQPFGAVVERLPGEAVYKTSLPGRPDGQYVTVMFLTQYKNQKVQEIITTVREGDGRWRVTGYSPKQLP